ncbi:MAG: T9SS type A sorting domain-containing protein [Bacteroidales bacterium]|nr:T9SS type A sorting domain-containing protein [Bacteroidales bacterium]
MKQSTISLLILLLFFAFVPSACFSQILEPDANTLYYLIHSSGNVVCENTDGRAIIKEATGSDGQLVQFVPDGAGYFWVKPAGQSKYMALSGSWNTYFITDSTTDASKYAIEKVSGSFVKLKCKYNSKYLGTDYITSGSNIYSDKSGTDSKHYWYISEHAGELPADTSKYLINPNAVYTNSFEGWGVSLCWWANMCGKWSDEKTDEIVDWLVSPDGLNFNIFRYNIGGGDDPLNRNCTLHHMADGKGLRAEMEGFKDSLNAEYNWSRDSAQRKIMLKIKEKRPDAIFEAFSNSPPYYMTYSGCCAGNADASQDNLKPEYYDEFAHYLVDVCKFYKDSFGIEFKTLEPFNEPLTNYWGANGEQEGCHFNTSSQIAFLKVLAPILEGSGLNTIISASDETNTAQSLTSFNAYITDNSVLDLIGQWNTHTYSATNQARANLRALSTYYNKTLWMSETGAGGTGISGNLGMAKKLMDDIRYIRPEAWIDWQYVEEGNDQWCFVTGDFNAQTYSRVKNYYVRQQFSQYIRAGSRFLYAPNDRMLAALSPGKDTLIIVALNNDAIKACHQIDLSLFDISGTTIAANRTSDTENNTAITDFLLEDPTLKISLPAYSITTLIIPIGVGSATGNGLETNLPYLILSRTASLVMQSSSSSIIINNYNPGDLSQLWKLTASGEGYILSNYAGLSLTDNGSYYATTSTDRDSGQFFIVESVGDDCYKILSTGSGKSLDLEGANAIANTKVGLWDYGTSPAASHRQWIFYPMPFADTTTQTKILESYSRPEESVRILGSEDALVILQNSGSRALVTVYDLSGIKLLTQTVAEPFTRISLSPGVYVVSHTSAMNNLTTAKVIIQ